MKKEAIFRDEEILQLIPQRSPIVMVDKFFGMEEDLSFSGLTVRPENLFCQNEKLQETGIIEHIAQSAAARIGYLYALQKKEVPLGFIGSVEKMKLFSLPKVGTELFTEITVIQEVFDITLIGANVTAHDQLIAECRMKIFIKRE